MELAIYNAACKAVSECRRIDEAKDIRDRAVAMAAYAKQAKNKNLEADAIEIRMRATRRLDQLRQMQKETVGLADGGTAMRARVNGQPEVPTLASQGIDKNLAHQARRLGELSDDEFEDRVSEARQEMKSLGKRLTKWADDNDDGASNVDEIEPANFRTAYLLRANQAHEFADDCRALLERLRSSSERVRNKAELVSAARAAADAWTQMAQDAEKIL